MKLISLIIVFMIIIISWSVVLNENVIDMKLYFFLFIIIFEFLGLLSSYAADFCPYNEEILRYEEKLRNFMEESNLLTSKGISLEDIAEELNENKSEKSQEKSKSAIDASNEYLRKMIVVFNELPLECAEKLVGKGVDRQLLTAGFPELTSIKSDSLVEALESILLLGYHSYFVKNNERILDFLYHEERRRGIFAHLLNYMARWHRVHDFALAAKFSLDEETNLEEMKTQANRAYNQLDFALYLPIWQGEARREQFIQLCQELGCKLDKIKECSPENKEDLWTVKATYLANSGDIARVHKLCNISVKNNGIYAEFWPITDDDASNYGLNFRKIGIINSNCAIDDQLNYARDYGFANTDNCAYVSAKMNEE